MLGVIQNNYMKMFFNRVLFKKEEIRLENTITGERITINKKNHLIEADFIVKCILDSLTISNTVKIDSSRLQGSVYSVGKKIDPQSLIKYLKQKHTYVILPDRIEELLDIKDYKNTGVVLKGTYCDYIVKEVNDKVSNIEAVEQLKQLKNEIFVQLSRNSVINVYQGLKFINTRGSSTFSSYMRKVIQNKGTKEEEHIELKDRIALVALTNTYAR